MAEPIKRLKTKNTAPIITTVDYYHAYVKQSKTRKPKQMAKKNVFIKVVKEYNKKIAEAILQGHTIKMFHGLGTLNIKEKTRMFKKDINGNYLFPVSYFKSMQKKKEIIERGGVPFKGIKDENNRIIGNNGGEHWLVYHTDMLSYKWHWTKSIAMTAKYGSKFRTFFFAYVSVFSFKPIRDLKRAIGKGMTKDEMRILFNRKTQEYADKLLINKLNVI